MTERMTKKHIEDYKQLWRNKNNDRLVTPGGVRFIVRLEFDLEAIEARTGDLCEIQVGEDYRWKIITC